MSRRMTVIGLTTLCTLAASAISTSGAFAGATEFACVEGGTTQTNEDCERGSTGFYGHESFSGLTFTQTDKLTNPVFTGKLFGATVELSATGVECVECTGENKEVGGVMEVTGGGKLKFTGVTVVGAPACTVVGSATGTVTTKTLKFTTTSIAGATYEPATGTLLAEFNITGGSCTVAGAGIKVTGKAFGARNGAKLTVNVTKASEELKLEGEKASLTSTDTVTGRSLFGEPHPIGTTTA